MENLVITWGICNSSTEESEMPRSLQLTGHSSSDWWAPDTVGDPASKNIEVENNSEKHLFLALVDRQMHIWVCPHPHLYKCTNKYILQTPSWPYTCTNTATHFIYLYYLHIYILSELMCVFCPTVKCYCPLACLPCPSLHIPPFF